MPTIVTHAGKTVTIDDGGNVTIANAVSSCRGDTPSAPPEPDRGQVWKRTSGAKRKLIGHTYEIEDFADAGRTIIYTWLNRKAGEALYTITRDKFLAECTYVEG
jgi:hypothetical protein